MSENISRLAVRSLDELHQMVIVQHLLRLCVEEDATSEEGRETIELLIDCYQSRMSLHLDELKAHLQGLLSEVKQL